MKYLCSSYYSQCFKYDLFLVHKYVIAIILIIILAIMIFACLA